MPDVIINGPEGRLEGRYTHSKIPNAPLALVLHSFPDQGFHMNSRIPLMLHQLFVSRGFSTLRFNFRGVGESQGVHDKGEGELADAAAALDWMQSINPAPQSVWVAGFSFGAWIGMQLLMRRPEIRGYVSICPPANVYDFSFLAPCPTSGLIIAGDKDTMVPAPAVQKLVDKLRTQKGISVDYRVIGGANHFFKTQLPQLAGEVHDHLNTVGVGRHVEGEAFAKLLLAA